MICKLVNSQPLKVLSFPAFKRLCSNYYHRANDGLAPGAFTYGCRRCETGAAIDTGCRQSLPDNVGLITLEEVTKMQEAKGKIDLPAWLSEKLLAEPNLEGMGTADLRPYWLTEVPQSKKLGQCVNCNQQNVNITACGMCSPCYTAGYGKKGLALLAALVAVTQGVKGNKELVEDEPRPKPELSPKPELKKPPAQTDRGLANDGYHPLFEVLTQALDQAQNGKGSERHANGLPFLHQPIMIETRSVGLGFPAGQARKKILEAINCCEVQPNRAIADLLGAINYAAAAVIRIREKQALSADLSQSGVTNA